MLKPQIIGIVLKGFHKFWLIFSTLPLTIKTNFDSPRRKVGRSRSQRRQCDGSQATQMTMKPLLGPICVAEFTNRSEAISFANRQYCQAGLHYFFGFPEERYSTSGVLATTSLTHLPIDEPSLPVADLTVTISILTQSFYKQILYRVCEPLGFLEAATLTSLTLTARAQRFTRLRKLGYLLLSI